MNKPLVTFALLSYNYERFIREAVRAALAQTYSPLQVIISDDCSQDRTFEIIQEEVDRYDGPHHILLNRNSHNLGSSGHYNRVMELAKGELIVAADGDDISLPTRTEELVTAWLSNGTSCVCSDHTIIDEEGTDMGPWVGGKPWPIESWQEAIRNDNAHYNGCTLAWERAVFETFGPLPDDIGPYTDMPIQFRSALLGRIVYVDKPLVKWRRHTTNASRDIAEQVQMNLAQFAKRHTMNAQRFRTIYKSWSQDIELFLSTHPEMEAELLQAMDTIAAKIELKDFYIAVQDRNLFNRLRSYPQAMKHIRGLGIKAQGQILLLSISPVVYLWAQKRYVKAKMLLIEAHRRMSSQ